MRASLSEALRTTLSPRSPGTYVRPSGATLKLSQDRRVKRPSASTGTIVSLLTPAAFSSSGSSAILTRAIA